MPKLPASAPVSKKRERAKEEMEKFSAGKLHSGSKTGPIVDNPAQAKAITMSVSGQAKDGKKRKTKRAASRGGRR